jgi:hypothetical protein
MGLPDNLKIYKRYYSCLKEMQVQKKKKLSRDWRKDHPETAPPWNPPHFQIQSHDTIVNAKKCLQTGAWYGFPLRGSANTWLGQIQILTANNWTELKDLMKKFRGRTEGSEEDFNPKGWRTILTNWIPQCSERLNHQPKRIHGSVHGSCYICSIGMPFLASMGVEALDPLEACCTSEGGC